MPQREKRGKLQRLWKHFSTSTDFRTSSSAVLEIVSSVFTQKLHRVAETRQSEKEKLSDVYFIPAGGGELKGNLKERRERERVIWKPSVIAFIKIFLMYEHPKGAGKKAWLANISERERTDENDLTDFTGR